VGFAVQSIKSPKEDKVVEPSLNKTVNLEDMLIQNSTRSSLNIRAESSSPRHKQIAWLNLTLGVHLALKVIELVRGSSQVLDANDWPSVLGPFSLLEAATI